ncbi:MAG: diguanylate cyclase [Rhizobium sp.]
MALDSHKMELDPLQRGRETQRLRLYFLLPLVIAILITEIVPITGIYLFTHRSVGVGGIHLQLSALDLYRDTIDQHAHALETTIDILVHDEDLQDGLARKDREALLEHAAPMFDSMKRTYGISHFYFTGPDRVNLLRVHDPERHGDVINRVTTRLAERRGTTTYGLELGPLGTFTLRVVAPWYDLHTRRLIGYVELGMETPEMVDRIRESLGAESFVLIRKEFLDQAGWEEGMGVFGRRADWNRFPQYVVSSQTLPAIPQELAGRFERGEMETAPDEPAIQFAQRFYRPLFVPINDVGGRTVATIALLVDVSNEVDAARLALLLGGIAYLAGGVLLFIVFYRLVGWIGQRIEDNERKLHELAAIDKLTGLFNNRIYQASLTNEITRAQRFGHPISVLMLDIDHFKEVNDTYGHVAGDRVLERLGHLLREYTCTGSSVCRYGGEEFAIILPELGAETAMETADRLRAIVEQTDFDIGEDRRIKATVSIGVAAFPESAATAEELTKAADAALYTAKGEGRNRVSRYRNSSMRASDSRVPT